MVKATAQESVVQAHLAMCHASVKSLAGVVERLRPRLAIALNTKPRGVPARADGDAPEGPALCPLASELAALKDAILAQADELDSLLFDLQL